jgi:hypothetical protein
VDSGRSLGLSKLLRADTLIYEALTDDNMRVFHRLNQKLLSSIERLIYVFVDLFNR